MSCGTGCKHSSYLASLWLWCRPTAGAPIQPLAWEPPYALGAALKQRQKKKKKRKKEKARKQAERQRVVELCPTGPKAESPGLPQPTPTPGCPHR